MGKRADKRSFTQGGSGRPYNGGRTNTKLAKGASPARVKAREAITQQRTRDAFAQDVIRKVIDQAHLSPEDQAFATLLVLGVVTTRGVLDDVLNRCMRTPHDVTDDVRDALCLSTYEIIYLNKSPHAAVDQGVELVRGIAPKAGGVANAILRKVLVAKKSFPFGDPTKDLAAYARLHGFPQWLAETLVKDLGAQAALDFMRASNEPAPVFVALNAAKASDEEILAVLGEAKGNPQPVTVNGAEVQGCYLISNGQVLLDGRVKRYINGGALCVSDAASQRVACEVLPQEYPESFLEIGAGRGTKTILLQSNAQRKWGKQIAHYATLDNHEFKVKLLKDRADQYGLQVETAYCGDATALEETLPQESLFDVVFIDAPCTGLGTLRRHPEIRWRLQAQTIAEYAQLGLRMLENASRYVAIGGTLCYATCTVTPEENAVVVANFLKSEAGAAFELVPIQGQSALVTQLAPGQNDAHFLAKMRRIR